MFKVLGCIVHEHDLRLVAISAVICVLGCLTTTTLLARAIETARPNGRFWLAAAAAVFGCSVWSLHFVAMLAFMPGQGIAYDLGLTALSIVVAVGGALMALFACRAPAARAARVALSGMLLGLAISGMHYVGVAAMTFSGFLVFDRGYVVTSVGVSILFAILAMARAAALTTTGRRVEVGGWLALAICGLHFTGMTAITVAPGTAEAIEGTVLGTSGLAVAVGGVSIGILIASLVAIVIERHLALRALEDLGRMRLMSNLA